MGDLLPSSWHWFAHWPRRFPSSFCSWDSCGLPGMRTNKVGTTELRGPWFCACRAGRRWSAFKLRVTLGVRPAPQAGRQPCDLRSHVNEPAAFRLHDDWFVRPPRLGRLEILHLRCHKTRFAHVQTQRL